MINATVYDETAGFSGCPDASGAARRWLSVTGGVRRAELIARLAVVHSATQAERALSALLQRGDAVVFHEDDEAWLIPVATRRITLAGETVVIGCTPAADVPRRSLVDELGQPTWRMAAPNLAAVLGARTDDAEIAGWQAIARRGTAGDLLRWPSDLPPPPRQVMRAGTLFGHLSGVSREEALAELAAWAGLESVASRDPSQDQVADAAPTTRLLVEAGPGSGKTQTIATRVTALVAKGISPARIHIVSFTRNAVAEMLARLAAAGVASDLECGTLDQLAGRIVGRFGEGGSADGYDATVERAVALVAGGDRRVLEWIGRREHLVVDEAQDVVGIRRDLLLALIDRLDPACGVTVACDPHQAIYGHQNKGETLAARCRDLGFAVACLARNHRAGSASLRAFVAEGRQILERGEAATVVAEMTELLHWDADGVPAVPEARGAQPFADLSLFRTGNAMAAYAFRLASEGIPYAMRGGHGGGGEALLGPAWIGALAPLIVGRGPSSVAPALEPFAASDPVTPAISAVQAMVAPALENGRYSEAALARAFSDGRLGTLAPRPGTLVLSTIHAAKGLEAETVSVFVPRVQIGHGEHGDPFEEARILYVAGTRARRRLEVGEEGQRWSRIGQRHVMRSGRTLLVEITPADSVGAALSAGVDFPRIAGVPLRGSVRLVRRDGTWFVERSRETETEMIATLPDGFGRDVRRAVQEKGDARTFAGGTAPFVGTLRIATVAGGDGRLKVVPVLEGFARIFLVEGPQ